MKRITYYLFIQMLLVFLFSSALTAQDYKVNTQQTIVKWKGSKVIAGSHEGTVSLKSGNVVYSDGLISSGNIVVDMTSIIDKDLDGEMKERLEGHLKSDDFFGVDNFPTASLVVKGSEKIDDNKLRLVGDLTIKGHTNPISFESSVKDNKSHIVFKGIIEVDRSLYDVRYGSGKFFDNLGDKAISDIFTLEFELLLDK